MAKVGLFGGSFNPAHRGHRRISLGARDALGLDEVWWLVTPGNPLKAGARDMAPLATRLRSARAMARCAPIRATAVEAVLGTRFAVDTVRALKRRHPEHRFVWLMGGDIVEELHRWRDWRGFARALPIAVIGRPGASGLNGRGRAASWLRRFAHPSDHAREWTTGPLPAVVPLRLPPDRSAATHLRERDPGWADAFGAAPVYDPLARAHIGGTSDKGPRSDDD